MKDSPIGDIIEDQVVRLANRVYGHTSKHADAKTESEGLQEARKRRRKAANKSRRNRRSKKKKKPTKRTRKANKTRKSRKINWGKRR